MQNETAYYIKKIKEDLSLKQRSNPQYSLRSYARDLGVHPATLSQIFKGTRPLPHKNSEQVIKKLNLGPKERTLFIESLMKLKIRLDEINIKDNDERFMLDESFYKVIAEWEHYAALELFKIKDFKCTVEEIATRFNLTQNRAEVVLDNLKTCGLLKINEQGQIEKTYADVRTTEDISSQALKDSHKETLEMSKNKLDEIEVELRDFSSATLAIDLKKLPEAKTIIREFRQKMTALLRDGVKTDVYQLAIQFYPLTKINKKQELQ
jgi:uncharacterized protein (TIGR02147 family)